MRWYMRRVIVAGCLAMVWFELTSSSPRVDLLNKLGASYTHFGVIEAVSPLMLLMQFVSALLVSRLRRRKPLWITLMVLQRAMAIPFALMPWFIPGEELRDLMIWCMIGVLAFGEGAANLSVPMWFSWMGDLLPHRGMGEFWARRRRWLALASTATLVLSSVFFCLCAEWDIRTTYLVVATLGAAAGVWDILLFLRIPEPQTAASEGFAWRRLLEPYRHPEFRRFIFFWAYWSFAAAFAYPFFRLFMLQYLKMPLYQIQAMFCFHAVGGALLAARLGRLCDRHGQRPVIILCTGLKSLIVIAFFLAQPGWAAVLLLPVFMLDNMLNTGMYVAQSGYMLRSSPRDNRATYVAAVLATSGLAGALSSVLSGRALESLRFLRDSPVHYAGLEWTHFHVVFLGSVLLRWGGIVAAYRLREPQAKEPGHVITQSIVPAARRWLAVPLGFFGTEESGRE